MKTNNTRTNNIEINNINKPNKSYLFWRISGHRQSAADKHSPATAALALPKASGLKHQCKHIIHPSG